MKKLSVALGVAGLLSQFAIPGAVQAQTVAQKLCVQPGEYAVIAQRSLPGAITQSHIFFCKDNAIVDNLGFGPNGRVVFSAEALGSGQDTDGTRLDAFVANDTTLYNANYFRTLLGENGLALPSGCQYGGGANSCATWWGQFRNAYWFVGQWSGDGYTCNAGSLRVQKVNITVGWNASNQAEFVVTKIDGDPCVPAGNVTFRGPLPSAVTAGTKITNVTTVLGYPNKPASTTGRSSINIIDANTFRLATGVTFTRIR